MATAKFYVYELIDPRDGAPFYVGKGSGRRHDAHVAEWRRGVVSNPKKFERIGEIQRSGASVVVRIVQSGLNEAEAFLGEQARIREIGRESLTNATRGGNNEEAIARTKATDLLSRTIRFGSWLAEKKRSLSDIALYWRVRRALHAMAY